MNNSLIMHGCFACRGKRSTGLWPATDGRGRPRSPDHHRACPTDTGHHRACPADTGHHRARPTDTGHHRARPGGASDLFTFGAALVFIFLFAFTPRTSAANLNIAFVDMNSVFDNYYRTIEMQSTLRERELRYRQRLDELKEELALIRRERDQMRETAINLALSAEVRANSRREADRIDAIFREKEQQLRQYQSKQKDEILNRYLDMREQLVNDLRRFLTSYARRKGYDIVMDSSGLTRNFIPVVIHYPPENDITAQVLKELNKGHEDILKNAEKSPAFKLEGLDE
jgi:Skp family chaperone for outer membrane proteins